MKHYNIILLMLLFLLASCAFTQDIVPSSQYEKNYLTEIRDLNLGHESLTCGEQRYEEQGLIMFAVQPYYNIESKKLYVEDYFEYTQTVLTPYFNIYKEDFMGNWLNYFNKNNIELYNLIPLFNCTWKFKARAKIVHSFEGIELRNEVRENFFYVDDLTNQGYEGEKVIEEVNAWLELVARYDYKKERVR